jgi:hypothetical protein
MARRLKSPGTVGSPMAINSPNVLILDSEDVSVTRVGSWSSVGDAEAVGGSYLQSNIKGDYLQFKFKGSALWIRFKFGSNCGKASITIDDKAYPTIDLYNDLAVFKYVNVAVGLDENVSHTVKIGVAGTKNATSTDYYVNVDVFMYRTTEEALSLQNIEYIDLINVINTINRINEIKIISNIANIDLVKEISNVDNVANISNIQNISNVANVSLIQKISLIQELSAVGKIYTISDVLGISSIGQIKDVLGISNIANVANISMIQKIKSIGDVGISTSRTDWIRNPSFETGDFTGWKVITGTATIVKSPLYEGEYACRLQPGAVIEQTLPAFPLNQIVISAGALANASGQKLIFIFYTPEEGTVAKTFDVLAPPTKTPIIWEPTTSSHPLFIDIEAPSTNTNFVDVDNITIFVKPHIDISDANQFSGTFAPSAAGSTTIVAAVAGEVIRVYDFSLWNSGTADVGVRLYFGTSGKNLFKGLLAAKTGVVKSFVRPWESNAGDSLVLYLSAAGTVDYGVGAVQA